MKYDTIDKQFIGEHSWLFVIPNKANQTGYLRATIKNKHYYLHRLIMEKMLDRKINKNERVDHINRDGADNRRSNLRLCSCQQNAFNQGVRKNNTSGYKGVTFKQKNNKWFAAISPNGKRISLGSFDDKENAASAYNQAAIKYFGEFAYLNPL